MLQQNEDSSSSTPKSQANGKSKAVDVEESTAKSIADDHDIDLWEPKPPKVLMEDPASVPLELRSQIQQYATTEYAIVFNFLDTPDTFF